MILPTSHVTPNTKQSQWICRFFVPSSRETEGYAQATCKWKSLQGTTASKVPQISMAQEETDHEGMFSYLAKKSRLLWTHTLELLSLMPRSQIAQTQILE